MKAVPAQSILLAIASTVTTAVASLSAPALAAEYAVKVECYGEHCFGIVFDQGTGKEVNVTDGEKNKRRAYRKARKLLEAAESGDGIVSEEWLRCQQDPAACGGL